MNWCTHISSWPSFHSTSLHLRTLHILTTINFISLHFTSLHFTSLYFTLLHFTSLHFTSLHFTSLHFTSLHFTSLRFCRLTYCMLFSSLQCVLHAPSISFYILINKNKISHFICCDWFEDSLTVQYQFVTVLWWLPYRFSFIYIG
jgi:hypothetical protein